ncbi:MAG: hypothetical protein AB1476_05655 [Candidatus Hadarchaeota archaeon]
METSESFEEKKPFPGRSLLSVLVIVAVAAAAAYLLTRPGGPLGGTGDNTGTGGGSGGDNGAGDQVAENLIDITLSEAVTRAKSDATYRGYSDAELTYQVSGGSFARDGKARWNLQLYSPSDNSIISYISTGFESITENSSADTLTVWADSSQVASKNQEVWDFADSKQNASVSILVDTFMGPVDPYRGLKTWRVNVSHGPPEARESSQWWMDIATGQKIYNT